MHSPCVEVEGAALDVAFRVGAAASLLGSLPRSLASWVAHLVLEGTLGSLHQIEVAACTCVEGVASWAGVPYLLAVASFQVVLSSGIGLPTSLSVAATCYVPLINYKYQVLK